jgi:hypothetical protein
MEFDKIYEFLEPSLRAFAYACVCIHTANGYNYCIARYLIYSSILIANVMGISGTATFGSMKNREPMSHLYMYA